MPRAAAAGGSLALGLALVAWGLAAQVPSPPSPSSMAATSGTVDRSTVTSTSDAAAASGPSGVADPSPGAARGSVPGAGVPGPGASEATPPSGAPGAPGPTAAGGVSPAPGTTAYPALDASPPVRVRLPSISVASSLHPLGLAADGTLEVPTGDRVDEAAWYAGSPTPGEVGPTVIEGHVTGPGGRPSVFFELGSVVVGDRVEVDREDGRTVVYEVYRVDRFAKADFPTVDVYGPTSGPEVRVITCGGEFDEASGHHVDNTVVYGRLVSATG